MDVVLTLDEQLFHDVSALAAASGRTISAVVEDALRESLLRRRQSSTRKPFKLPTFNCGGLMPGVDIDNSAALLDIMEEDDRP